MDTYEEKYNEALERAKDYFKANQRTGELEENDMLSDIFPELKESEDERIRKKLIEVVKGDMVVGGTKDKQLAIAWLEKQGKKNPYKEDFGDLLMDVKFGIVPSQKQDEQKSAENEELTEFDKAVGVSIGTWNPKSPEQIQSVKAVSKKLLKLAKKQINDEQKPAEWSEEDEKVIHCLEYTVRHFYEDEDTIKWCCDWLKSLRPQKQWKPSREQIMALRWVLNHIPYDSHKEEISGLLEQLKKLREE